MASRTNRAEHREMLLNMAAIWDSLAKDRQADAVRKQRLAELQARSVPSNLLQPRVLTQPR